MTTPNVVQIPSAQYTLTVSLIPFAGSQALAILPPSVIYKIQVGSPYVITACTLVPVLEPEEAQPEDAIFTPVPPGVEYETLPIIDPETEIIDTAPNQIIGCANNLPPGQEQFVLDTLFPDAIEGDGAINRENNDIWKYDGFEWENVGPTPGPTLVAISVLPPWNEISVYTATVRTRFLADSVDYSLNLLAVASIVTRAIIDVEFKRIYPVLAPSAQVFLDAFAPELRFEARRRGKVVDLVRYTGNSPNSQPLSAPWPVGMAIQGSVSFSVSPGLMDVIRGDDLRWQIQSNSADVQILNGFAFNEGQEFVTVGNNNTTNALGQQYYAWLFRGTRAPVVNTDGIIETSIRESQVYNLIEYTGTGIGGDTLGHGLGTAPDFVFGIRVIPESSSSFRAGGLAVGGDFWSLSLSFTGGRAFNSNTFGSFLRLTDSTIEVGTDSSLNFSGSRHILYAFKEVAGLSKIGFYVGNGLLEGTPVNCGFPVGFLLVKRRDQNHPWMVFTENMPSLGRRYQRFDQSGESQAQNEFYSLDSKGFRVKNEFPNDTGGNTTQLNEFGAEYIYLAFASGFYLKKQCPSVSFGLSVGTVAISAGASVFVAVVSQELMPLNPPYAGVRASVNAVPRTRFQVTPITPGVRSGVTLSPEVVRVSFKVQPVGYAGEATSDIIAVLDTISSRDQQPLEESTKGSVLRLVKRLRDAGLWDKIDTLNLLCVARTRLGAMVPLKGTYPVTPDDLDTRFDYSRRTGIRVNTTSFAQINTNVYNSSLAIADNHLAAYVQELNASPFTGGDLIGDSFSTNAMAIGRRTAISGFETRNKNNTTSQTAAPHWSQPSLAGISRDNTSNYEVRVAGSTRVVSQAIGDPNFVNAGIIRLFNFWNGNGDFRVPMYSMGKALDLGVLDSEITLFLQDLKERGLPDRMIHVPPAELLLAAFTPILSGNTVARVSVIEIELLAVSPTSVGRLRIAVSVPANEMIAQALAPVIAGGALISVPIRLLDLSANAPRVFEVEPSFAVAPINLNLSDQPVGVSFGSFPLATL
jgi:hypothetical protein